MRHIKQFESLIEDSIDQIKKKIFTRIEVYNKFYEYIVYDK